MLDFDPSPSSIISFQRDFSPSAWRRNPHSEELRRYSQTSRSAPWRSYAKRATAADFDAGRVAEGTSWPECCLPCHSTMMSAARRKTEVRLEVLVAAFSRAPEARMAVRQDKGREESRPGRQRLLRHWAASSL
jgi:hypothetical protein